MERFHLLLKYINELQTMKGLPVYSCSEFSSIYYSYINEKDSEWIDIYSEDNKRIGFLIIGRSPNCHPDADFYIEEAYIHPRYRHKGYMRGIVSKFVKHYKGTYCMFILDNHCYAKMFWSNLFSSLDYTMCHLDDIGAAAKGCTQYGFSPC